MKQLPQTNTWLLLVYMLSIVYALVLIPLFSDPNLPMDAVIYMTVNVSFGYWCVYLLLFTLTFEPQKKRKLLLVLGVLAFYAALIFTNFEIVMHALNYTFSVFFKLMTDLVDVKIISLTRGISASEAEKQGLKIGLDAFSPILGGLFMGWCVGLFMAGAHSVLRRLMSIRLKPTFLTSHFWGGGFAGAIFGMAILYTLAFTGKGNPSVEQTIGFCFSFFMHIPHLLMCAKHPPQRAEGK